MSIEVGHATNNSFSLRSIDDELEHERRRAQVFAREWHAGRREITQLNRALRRANRRIKRQKDAITLLRKQLPPSAGQNPERR